MSFSSDNPESAEGPLLELIPEEEVSTEQKAFRVATASADEAISDRLYRFRRKPWCFDDFIRENDDSEFAYWCENGTILCVQCGIFFFRHMKESWEDCLPASFQGQNVCFSIELCDSYKSLWCTIYGKTDTTVAETLTWFLSLEFSNETQQPLTIKGSRPRGKGTSFDFAALQPEQLARILDKHSAMQLDWTSITWSPELSVILATRPYPMNWKMAQRFCDGGTTFVDALQAREASFGALSFTLNSSFGPLSLTNLRRLFQLEGIFDKLDLECCEKEYALLPFSANVATLKYQLEAIDLEPNDFDSLDIVPKDLRLSINLLRSRSSWGGWVVSLLNRVAELAHFERLDLLLFRFRWDDDDLQNAALVAEALIRAVQCNPNLSFLDLSSASPIFTRLNWTPYLERICDAVENNNGLDTCTIAVFDPKNESFYSLLEEVLSRNRRITVCDKSGNVITNGSTIEWIYAVNRFHNKMTRLARECTSVRPTLMAMAVATNAPTSFVFTAMFISNLTDLLCECVDGLDLEEEPSSDL
ncbi:hypothetical protein FisN_10Lu426 [Fistulifera solaris]|uniref:Uncharacterized protein n=1 Tax=Fistulifera solaris TaxID=1519565 RepID=A0A1Z5JUJ9_FISSO|nr:hypothetical protein FisN_10Lu426 [Fistulifera solaris]|eukprot:GAX17707.1 hypothetical protein FisN_10Lu426 [Fistulifera solaris]